MVNLLQNPGFEIGDPGNPYFWGKYSTGTNQIYTYPESGRIGGRSVAIEFLTREIGKISSFVQSIIPIDNTKIYKLSGWIKAQNIVGSGAIIQVDWKNSIGSYLSTSHIMAYKRGTVEWTYFEGNVAPAKGAVYATIVLQLYDSSGKVWFDDILFEETTILPCTSPVVVLTIPA